MYRIGVVKVVSHSALDLDERGFEAALADAGLLEGVNVEYIRRDAEGDLSQAAAIAEELRQEQVYLIHGIATPTTQALVRSCKRVPIVFSAVTDPVGAGIVPKGSAQGKATGTNVTGVSDPWPVYLQLELYRKIVPDAKIWGTIYNPAEENSAMHVNLMRTAAKSMKIELVEAKVSSAAEVEGAVRDLADKVQAINITSDNTSFSMLDSIVAICNERKIPLFSGDIDGAAMGAIAAYGLDYFQVGYAAGQKAVQVIRGAKVGTIAWGPVGKYSLHINKQAAEAQGVKIPTTILRIADKILE
ncbi:MAG: ABC transporter substrate-binding protein [Spirochaetaceae bacterium]|nr:ABC transporter substrate-binding protein [Spirochaetaceae bacterium]